MNLKVIITVMAAAILGVLIACGLDEGDSVEQGAQSVVATASPVSQPPADRNAPAVGAQPAPGSPVVTTIPIPTPTSYADPVLGRSGAQTPSSPQAATTAVSTQEPATEERPADYKESCADFSSRLLAQNYFIKGGGNSDNRLSAWDADGDGVACDSPDDYGIEDAPYSPHGNLHPVLTATAQATAAAQAAAPTRTPTNTPTPLPANNASIWESPERTAELNAIDWHALQRRGGFPYELFGLSIREAGRELGLDFKCEKAIGNVLGPANPTSAAISEHGAYLWIEPSDGGAPFCVGLEYYRNWNKDTKPLAPPDDTRDRERLRRDLPEGNKDEPIVFAKPDAEEIYHTVPPAFGQMNAPFVSMLWKAEDTGYERDLWCRPEYMPVAVWTTLGGFQTLSEEEEKLLADEVFGYYFGDDHISKEFTVNSRPGWFHHKDPVSPDDFYESYDWESKNHWREQGWFFTLFEWYHEDRPRSKSKRDMISLYGKVDMGRNLLFKAGGDKGCWLVHNPEDLPEPRYCLECERRAKMKEILLKDE